MSIRNPKLKFKEAMRFESEVEAYIKKWLVGYSINIPAGKSRLGSVKCDIYPQTEDVLYMDHDALKFPNDTFDSAVSDPVWKLGQKEIGSLSITEAKHLKGDSIGYYQRMRPFFELIRVVKVGGYIIYSATWYPESKAVEEVETRWRQSAPFGNISLISVHKKVTDEYDDPE